MKEWNKIVFNVWYEKVVTECITFQRIYFLKADNASKPHDTPTSSNNNKKLSSLFDFMEHN